ncbi:hypothetical protein [Shewanella aestuarii]|uniref:Nitrate/nitrite sensing protein domain-containing protein n=1 Tax=Shewanella aestuarii TaxID=1028752 RepID=A0A6G9QP60_9GAMM|nr:hypothetical protein [Shewanella aestuarii]QIR15601.1 hypothetical protein HBH39_14820 [Shewanella aestuarii]
MSATLYHQAYIALISTLIVIGLFIGWVKYQQRKQLTKQLAGIALIKGLKKLIVLLQKHRGITAGIVSGDKSMQLLLGDVRSTIRQQMNDLQLVSGLIQHERWLIFLEHWQKLQPKSLIISVDNAYKQHTLMISNLLFLIEDKSNEHLLSADYLSDFPHIDLVWRELLHAAECIGQARALGTSAAAANHCTSLVQVRLNFLYQKIENSQLLIFERVAQSRYTLDMALQSQLGEAQERVSDLTRMIKQHILTQAKIVIPPQAFYDLASDALDAFIAVFDAQVARLEQTLKVKQ